MSQSFLPEEQFKKFVELVKSDTAVQDKLKSAADLDAVLTIAKEVGFTFTTDSIGSSSPSKQNLSEDDLERVAGGGLTSRAVLENGRGTYSPANLASHVARYIPGLSDLEHLCF